MTNKKNHLTTGEFAKLCNVTKHTLFHYHDIGLFEPAFSDDNGYRYYHALQYDSFCAIAQLRTIGMSLSEIKAFLDNRTPRQLITLYQEQEDAIAQQIKQLKEIKKAMASTRSHMEQALLSINHTCIQYETQSRLSISKCMHEADDLEMTLTYANLVRSIEDDTLIKASGMMHPTQDLKNMKYDNNCYFYLCLAQATKDATPHTKSSGDYLTTYHHGQYDSLHLTYERMFVYAETHHIRLGEWCYEERIIDELAINTDEGYILKVSIRIILT